MTSKSERITKSITSIKMEYSRSYLQGLQEKTTRVAENRSAVEKIVYSFIHEVLIAASNGHTCYLYEHRTDYPIKDLISGFQTIFPECDITHDGSRLDEGKRIPLIIIDWSKANAANTTPSPPPSPTTASIGYSDMPYPHSFSMWSLPAK
jgi:hypothetical protein